ncbi:unnamed protein product [Adineta ricciae]|uniref:Uncharacterized protein n=1 Tax=Adineta ricciae TaxID=249248 RepID=A0A816EXM2_ADIRI|nr:unnamed protein product [Adineta ricciae]CAF1655125.1 unnamed protein product [Adineta ricciae]
MHGNWRKQKNDLHDGWYDGQYESRHLSIDFIQGSFLVDDATIGFLPANITTNPLFVRVFGSHVFEVQAAELPHTYISKHLYHGAGRALYEFHVDEDNKRLTIKERHVTTNDIYQLIPHDCFKSELADTFVSDHSHWWHEKKKIVEFRPVEFQNSKFLDNKPYVLELDKGFILTTDKTNQQMLMNQSSSFFRILFNEYFNRLDNHSSIYMMRESDSQSNIIVHIHLPRLGIAFQYNNKTDRITSREYSDMCIAKDQWFGTLTGLTSGLLLSPLSDNNHCMANYPYRKLIVPFGKVCSSITPPNEHQTVIISPTSTSGAFSRDYFVFILNDRLKVLQSTGSPTGWLYLALLHAMTSHPLPDQYTGMTGMERAFQLLKSAGCSSDQPFDETSLNILVQIASITPKVEYYPKNSQSMETIHWSKNGPPYSMQHFGYYFLAKNIYAASQQFNFMYSSSSKAQLTKIFDEEQYNEQLLKKLYWNYRDSYNSTAKLPQEMEDSFGNHIDPASPHQSTTEQCLHTTSCFPVDLVHDLYNSGSVELVDQVIQNWLPLSRWLTEGRNLRNIWIGLLRLADRLKTQAAGANIDDIQRFEYVLDFLHYISKKCNINPYYLQLLKTQLKAWNITLQSVTFPLFTTYQNIEDISVNVKHLSFLGPYKNKDKQIVISEVQAYFSGSGNSYNTHNIVTPTEMNNIHQLIMSWRNNAKLRSFLEILRNLFHSVRIETFDTKVAYVSQQFACESFVDHYQIRLKPSNKAMDANLLSKADAKFHQTYQGHFTKTAQSSRSIIRQQEPFPEEIFLSVSQKDNPLTEIGDFFKNQLSESWNKFLADKPAQYKDPLTEELIELLRSFTEESLESWKLLEESLTNSNEQLFQSGLTLRITPTALIPLLQQNTTMVTLSAEQRTLFGGILVNLTLQQQIERALHFAYLRDVTIPFSDT